MERIAILIERTGDQLSCLLNPQKLEQRRSAGLGVRRGAGGVLHGRMRSDDPLVATGGGSTELDLELLFDADIASEGRREPVNSFDVRTLTRPFWSLSETGEENDPSLPVIRFIWGKAWNIPAVVLHAAERLEQFDQDGCPRRSWLSLRLRRVDEAQVRQSSGAANQQSGQSGAAASNGAGQESRSIPLDQDGGPMERFDEVAARRYGDPELAWALAGANGIDDPLTLSTATSGASHQTARIQLPSAEQLERFR